MPRGGESPPEALPYKGRIGQCNQGGTMTGRGRSVYFEDKFWRKAQRFARSKGLSVSTWIRGLMAAAMKEE